MLVFGSIVWFAYDRGRAGTGGPPPLIRADAGPTKTRPEQPGGMQVPYQDTMVYDRLQPGADKNKKPPVESLLPPPEAPMARPEPTRPAVERPVETLQPAPVITAPAPTVLAPTPQVASAAPNKLPELPKARVDTASPIALAPPGAKQEAAKAPAPATTASADYRLQLGAVPSEEAARSTFAKLKASHSDLLGKLSMQTETVQSGGTTLYRIKAGPLDAATAKDLCAKLSAQKVGCLVR
ncbi:SPOR domain-containing protein [Roseiterribacter gracilis]|uniref:SPOR domain-containing protein n=1 Tax=Roseiterribacter gracilis TaxID=2812848 RepID=UPI003B436317